MTGFDRAFIWLGGAAFVFSLAACTFAFVVTWGQSLPFEPDWPEAVTVNVALLVVFAAHHSVFARDRAKVALAGLVPERLLRSVYVWIASLLLIAVVVLWRPVGGELYLASGWIGWLLLAVQLAGLFLIVGSVRVIDALELAGIHRQAERQGLQVVGPYRLVRHPLYLGWMLIVFGPAHMTGDRLLFAMLTSLYLVVAIPWEERSLQAAFGENYHHYTLRVKWRVIPYVY
jgi:protein-S-isoprenylcysteine O-methyltransferase Ste14